MITVKNILLTLLLFTLTFAYAQSSEYRIFGTKALYSLVIPDDFFVRLSKGMNVDIKYVNKKGCSILTVVRDATKYDFEEGLYSTDDEIKSVLEYSLSEKVKILKREVKNIDGLKTSILIYETNSLYSHSTLRYYNNKMINLLYTVPIEHKDAYKFNIIKVVNSFRINKS